MTKKNRAAEALETVRSGLIDAGHVVDAVLPDFILADVAYIQKIDGVYVHMKAKMEQIRTGRSFVSTAPKTTGKVLIFLRCGTISERFHQSKHGTFDIARLCRVVSELVSSETRKERERLHIERLYESLLQEAHSECVKQVCVASTSTVRITIELPPDRAKELLVIIKGWEQSHG